MNGRKHSFKDYEERKDDIIRGVFKHMEDGHQRCLGVVTLQPPYFSPNVERVKIVLGYAFSGHV